MPAQKNQTSAPATKPAAAEGKTKTKASAKQKVPAPSHTIMTLEEKKAPKYLDRLYIPGMSENVKGYDAGVPKWLFESGMTIQVDKGWAAAPGDVITVGKLLDDGTVSVLATKQLNPGEELNNAYFFAAEQKDLPDGPYALVYVVHYAGGTDYDRSYPLLTLVKTDLPAGDDNDGPTVPGHSGLKFSVSETVIVPGNASKGVTITLQPPPNTNPTDEVDLHWGSVIKTQNIAGALKPTVILVTYADLLEAGDSDLRYVWLEVRDLVGNVSTPGSASVEVSVNLGQHLTDGPVIVNGGPPGYIDLEVVGENPLELQVRTPSSVGGVGDIYDVMFRIYPPKGGVKIIHKFVEIRRGDQVYSVFIDYLDVRMAAEGRVETSFVLRKSGPPYEVYSKKTAAEVRGSVVRLEPPDLEGYPDAHISNDPAHVIARCRSYAWRQPTDEILWIFRLVKGLNEVILHTETQIVGQSWPVGAPVKQVFYWEQLRQFKGYSFEFYYVISSSFTRARAIDLNESLRRILTIS